MRRLFLFLHFYFLLSVASAQTAEGMMAELKAINRQVAGLPCNADSAAVISHRAMNVFLGDKTGYLAGSNELSFYTNYFTLNTAEGKISVNHNFQKAGGIDDRVKGIWRLGFDMTFANDYSKGFTDNRFENELDLSIGYKWLGKVKTLFADCNAAGNQKSKMDILRATLLFSLLSEIEKKEKDFKTILDSIQQNSANGEADSAESIAARYHYTALKDLYNEKFALQQAALLTETRNFKRISTGWTSITAYIPLFTPKYQVAESFNGIFQSRHPYAFDFLLSHTRLSESSKSGRLFITVSGSLLFNNSKLGYGLAKMSAAAYAVLRGTGSITDIGNNRVYAGNYKIFLTPSASVRAVYFPTDSHIGISLLAEQHFGTYNLLDAKLGIPIVLINYLQKPAVNIECYLLLFDLGNTKNRIHNTDKTALGISVGIPFSRLMY